MNRTFNINDLIKDDIQYPNLTIKDFAIGEEVFLKSNPKNKLIVFDIDKSINQVYTNGGGFLPQQLYKYNGNIIINNYLININ